MVRNNLKIKSASNFLEHLTMITFILRLPRAVEGSVVECGSYKGGSAANLSLVCALCRRRLEIFDSFRGLPQPSPKDKKQIILSEEEIHTYNQFFWCGSLEEVKKNISKYGKIKVCNFHRGYFKKTLPKFNHKCVFIFLDVCLLNSTKTCLKYLWPLLADGGYLFTHEAAHLEIAALFFDKKWWRKLNTNPPGLVGAGSGLGLMPNKGYFKSAIGYTIKNPKAFGWREVIQG